MPTTGLILGLYADNERQRYFVTTSLIGWVQAQNQPWMMSALTSILPAVPIMLFHGISDHRQFDCLFNSLFGLYRQNIKALHYWAFVMVIHWSPVDSHHKGPVIRKAFYISYHHHVKWFTCCWLPPHVHHLICPNQPLPGGGCPSFTADDGAHHLLVTMATYWWGCRGMCGSTWIIDGLRKVKKNYKLLSSSHRQTWYL